MTTEPLTIRTYITLTGVAASVTLDLELATYEHIVSEMNDLDNVIIGIDHDGSRYVWSRAAIVSVEANLSRLRQARERRDSEAAAEFAEHVASLTPGALVLYDDATWRVTGVAPSGALVHVRAGSQSLSLNPDQLKVVTYPDYWYPDAGSQFVTDSGVPLRGWVIGHCGHQVKESSWNDVGGEFLGPVACGTCAPEAPKLEADDIVTYGIAPSAFRIQEVNDNGSRAFIENLESGVGGWVATVGLTLHPDPDAAISEIERAKREAN